MYDKFVEFYNNYFKSHINDEYITIKLYNHFVIE